MTVAAARSQFIRRLSVTGLVLAAIVVFAALGLSYADAKALADRLHRTGDMKGFTPDLFTHLRTNIAGVAVLGGGLCLAALAMAERLNAFLDELRKDGRDLLRIALARPEETGGWHSLAIGLAAVCGLGLALRLGPLFAPLKNDEAVSYVDFAAQSLRQVLTGQWSMYHALNNVLIWVTVHLLGNAEWAIRTPTLLAGLAVIPLTYFIAAAAFSRRAGTVAAAIVAVAWPMVEYSTNARGYMLGTMFLLAGILLLLHASRRDNRAAWLGGSLCLALSAYCVSTMVIQILAAILWLTAMAIDERHQPWGRLAGRIALAGGVLGLGTLALYATFWFGSSPRVLAQPPVYALPDPNATIGMAFGSFVAGSSFLMGLLLPWPLSLVFPALAALGACASRRGLALACAMILAELAFLMVSENSTPPARCYVPFLPLASVLAGHGIDRLAARIGRTGARILAVPGAVLLVWAAWAATHPSERISAEAGAFPEAPAVSRFLLERLAGGEALIGDGVGIHLIYYMIRDGRSQGRVLRYGTLPGMDQPMLEVCASHACDVPPMAFVLLRKSAGSPQANGLAALAPREDIALPDLVTIIRAKGS